VGKIFLFKKILSVCVDRLTELADNETSGMATDADYTSTPRAAETVPTVESSSGIVGENADVQKT
jgi:hypothetical protein